MYTGRFFFRNIRTEADFTAENVSPKNIPGPESGEI